MHVLWSVGIAPIAAFLGAAGVCHPTAGEGRAGGAPHWGRRLRPGVQRCVNCCVWACMCTCVKCRRCVLRPDKVNYGALFQFQRLKHSVFFVVQSYRPLAHVFDIIQQGWDLVSKL